MAEPGTCPAKIPQRKLLGACFVACSRTTCQTAFSVSPSPQTFPFLFTDRLVPSKAACKQDGQERAITFTFQQLKIGGVPEPLRWLWR